MTDAEMFSFMDTFRSLTRVFPLRGDEHEIRDVGASYFRAMRRFPLRAIQDGAEGWILHGKRFPKPAEWIESIPKRAVAPVEVAALSEEAMATYLRAEGLRYEDRPCTCRACVAAGVSEKPLRFVPEVDATGADAKALIGERTVVAGHWAHGEELAGYYRAKNAFWTRMLELFGADTPAKQRRTQQNFEARMKEIYQETPRGPRPPTEPTKVTT